MADGQDEVQPRRSDLPVTGYLPALGREGRHGPDRAGAYAKAKRHSSRVRALKIAIPAGAFIAAALVFAASVYKPFGDIPGLTIGGISISGTKIAMENPRLTGFRQDNRPYEVNAKAAFQDVRKPGVVELKDVNARLTTDGAGTGRDARVRGRSVRHVEGVSRPHPGDPDHDEQGRGDPSSLRVRGHEGRNGGVARTRQGHDTERHDRG
jgi:hypothetical protein